MGQEFELIPPLFEGFQTDGFTGLYKPHAFQEYFTVFSQHILNSTDFVYTGPKVLMVMDVAAVVVAEFLVPSSFEGALTKQAVSHGGLGWYTQTYGS
jgi:hypothetical protein